MKGIQLHENLHSFIRHIDSIKDTYPMTLLLLNPYQKRASQKIVKFMEENAEEIENEDGEKTLAIKFEQHRLYENLSKNAEISVLATKIIPESLFVALISQYDAFFNRLLRALFELQPEYLNNSERTINFSQLVEFASIDDAREYVIEKEVETILRKSHSAHFEYLESKLSMPLRKNLPIWQKFIEITERRNLFVHCDGVVSSQYIKVCNENKCDIGEIKVNDRHYVPIEYFNESYECLYEIATKLTHTLWRKLIKNDLKSADGKLNEICYDLMTSKQYKLADIMLEFSCSQTRHFNDAMSNIFTINKALSKYLQNDKKKAKEIINSKDWSASSDDFKLAHLAITEDFDGCFILMRKMGSDGEVDKENYMTWPLFTELRQKEEFKVIFKDLFGEEYTVLEVPERPIQELISERSQDNSKLKKKKVANKRTNGIAKPDSKLKPEMKEQSISKPKAKSKPIEA